MDITLINNAPNFLAAVNQCTNDYGYNIFDQCNGIFELIGSYLTIDVDNWISHYSAEINAVIDFAGMWSVNLTEWELDDPFDRLKFAAQYIAYELQKDEEYNNTNNL